MRKIFISALAASSLVFIFFSPAHGSGMLKEYECLADSKRAHQCSDCSDISGDNLRVEFLASPTAHRVVKNVFIKGVLQGSDIIGGCTVFDSDNWYCGSVETDTQVRTEKTQKMVHGIYIETVEQLRIRTNESAVFLARCAK